MIRKYLHWAYNTFTQIAELWKYFTKEFEQFENPMPNALSSWTISIANRIYLVIFYAIDKSSIRYLNDENFHPNITDRLFRACTFVLAFPPRKINLRAGRFYYKHESEW